MEWRVNLVGAAYGQSGEKDDALTLGVPENWTRIRARRAGCQRTGQRSVPQLHVLQSEREVAVALVCSFSRLAPSRCSVGGSLSSPGFRASGRTCLLS